MDARYRTALRVMLMAMGMGGAAAFVPAYAHASPGARCDVPSSDQIEGQPEATARTLGLLIAHSTVPETRVTMVASIGLTATAGAVHALIQQPDRITAWVRLPFNELPEAAFVMPDERIICLSPVWEGDSDLFVLDPVGRQITRRSLEGLLPPGAMRSEVPVSLMPASRPSSLGVPLQDGPMALVELGSRKGLVRDPGDFELEAAIEADPEESRGYRELAQFHYRRGEIAEQLACLETGVARLHDDTQGVVNDGWQVGTPAARLVVDYLNALRAAGDEDRTEDALDLALGLYPCMEQLVLMRAEIWIDHGEVDRAIASLRAALAKVDPNADLAAAHHDVGRFLDRKGQSEAALYFCEDAYALGDHSEFLLRGLADISVELGQPERAVEWLTLLAERWRVASDSIAEATRAERAHKRLEVLEKEISDLQPQDR